jgi:hypothetical protein
LSRINLIELAALRCGAQACEPVAMEFFSIARGEIVIIVSKREKREMIERNWRLFRHPAHLPIFTVNLTYQCTGSRADMKLRFWRF